MARQKPGLDSTLRYDFADVENCLENAARLKGDARWASQPTKAALLELALEEVGKGSILCLRLFAKRKQEDPQPLLSEEGESLKNALLGIATPQEVDRIKDAYDIPAFVQMADLDELFAKHPPKLAGIVRLGKIVRVTQKVIRSHPRQFERALQSTPKLVRRLKAMARVPDVKFKRLSEVNRPEYLLDIREKGIYVGLDPRRGATVEPSIDTTELRKLRHALDASAVLVKGWIIAHKALLES